MTYEKVPKHYPGTGDFFGTVIFHEPLTGGLMLGDSLPIAISRATSFCEYAIKTTFGYGTNPREGVMLEKCLPVLTVRQSFTDYTSL